MNAHTQPLMIAGPAGQLEGALDLPDTAQFSQPVGLALVAHPHPLHGGTMDNKVAQTIARSFVALGYVTARINFRGVGQSAGTYDEGRGETDDMAALLAHMRTLYPDLPLALGGFSFGTFVQSQLQHRLDAAGTPAERLVLVGTAAHKWAIPTVPANTILIHGEHDDVIPLQWVMDWARPQELPVVVIPGADHFFHRRLQHIKNMIVQLWHRRA